MKKTIPLWLSSFFIIWHYRIFVLFKYGINTYWESAKSSERSSMQGSTTFPLYGPPPVLVFSWLCCDTALKNNNISMIYDKNIYQSSKATLYQWVFFVCLFGFRWDRFGQNILDKANRSPDNRKSININDLILDHYKVYEYKWQFDVCSVFDVYWS